MLVRILIGLVITGVGFLIVKKPEIAWDFIGDSEFAQRFFRGGNLGFYRLLGVAICIAGLLVITNLYGQIFEWLLDFIY